MSYFISRLGLMGQKIGMTTMFIDRVAYAVTLIRIPQNFVIEKKEEEDYGVVKLGVQKNKNIKNPQLKEFEKNGQAPCSLTKEFRITKEELATFEQNAALDVEKLKDIVYFDVTSKNIGKGFAGGMKKWGFSGGNASHGSSLFHRGIGSTGTREFNWKGKKMPGRMGGEVVTVQNLKALNIDTELGVIALFGSVPGRKGEWVKVCRSIKKGDKK